MLFIGEKKKKIRLEDLKLFGLYIKALFVQRTCTQLSKGKKTYPKRRRKKGGRERILRVFNFEVSGFFNDLEDMRTC